MNGCSSSGGFANRVGVRPLLRALTAACLLHVFTPASAQDLEPRRWTQLPTGVNFVGVGVAHSSGEIFIDPVLEIEDAEVKLGTAVGSYVRSFGLLGKSARFDVTVPWQSGEWTGLVSGEPRSVRRVGLGDPRMRLSVLLYGGPAQTPSEFASSKKSNTVVGAALAVTLPTGEYSGDKLINLGNNRWVIRPQLGVTHTRGKWTFELTGSVFLFSDNDDFFGDTKLETDPLAALQGHVIYTFRPGLWAAVSTAYGDGGQATVDGLRRDGKVANWLYSASVGLPVTRRQGLKLSYIRTSTQVTVGADIDTFLLGYSWMF